MCAKKDKEEICFSCTEFLESVRQCFLDETCTTAPNIMLMCPTDDEDDIEYHMFHAIRSMFDNKEGSCSHVPAMRLDGECIISRDGRRKIVFDRDYEPDASILATGGNYLKAQYSAVWGDNPWMRNGSGEENGGYSGSYFHVWTFQLFVLK